jgi:FG-GAP repeat
MPRLSSKEITHLGILSILLSILLISIANVSVSSFSDSRSNSFATRNYLLTLSSPNAQRDGWFGKSMGTSGDLVAIGAPFEKANGDTEAGRTYAFNMTSGALLRTLSSPNAQMYGWFGFSVAISGELLVVGAPHENVNDYSQAGDAYVFNVTNGKLVTTLTSPNTQDYGWFGFSIAISGKIAIIGAPHESIGEYMWAGYAYAFNIESGKLLKTLVSPNMQFDGYFGYSLATSSRFILVGAVLENTKGHSSAGRAYVFDATTYKMLSTLTSPNSQLDGEFGYSVSISNQLAIVGAPSENASGYTGAGHAYVFNTITGKLDKILSSPEAQENGHFGWSVFVSAKLALVGAPYETADNFSGAGHLFEFNAVTGKLLSSIISPDPQYNGWFGYSIVISGKLVMIGAPREKANGYREAGHAYILQ